MKLDKGKAIKNNGTYYKECQHDCTEKKIGYECVCNEGYELAPDKHSCTGRKITGFTGFAQVTKQVHIPMNLLTLQFITYIYLMLGQDSQPCLMVLNYPDFYYLYIYHKSAFSIGKFN